MNSVKTYNQVNREDLSISIEIARMDDVFVRRNGVIDEPHRHDFFTIILAIDADGQHFIDFNEFELKGSQIYFISPGQVHQLIEKRASLGYSILFSHQFLIENNIPVAFIQDLNLFQDFGYSPPLELSPSDTQVLRNYAEQMLALHHSNIKLKYEAIGSWLKLLLIHCNQLCNQPLRDNPVDGAHHLFREFKSLIDQHYREWHSTNEYASQLHITPDYLNRVVKSASGKTAKEHIQSRIIVAAKRLLYFTELSNKEIGYELGFNEASNFSSFFKKCVGMSPSVFKDSQ